MRSSNEFQMLIDGNLEGSAATINVVNPATEQVIGHVPDCSPEQLDRAITAATRAFPSWKSLTPAERGRVLLAVADRLEENVDLLGRLLMLEQGKPLSEAKMEVARSAAWFRQISEVDLSPERRVEPDGRIIEIRHVPIGVVAAIAPWNFPIILAMLKLAPALYAGNTVVLKPSPFTPLATLKLAALIYDLFPAGVLNVITGGDQLGPMLSDHPGIGKISFTGSTQTGRKVMESAARGLKRVTLELGGNDPAIVLPDIDIDDVAEKIFWAAFRNAGQVCIAAKRIYVHNDIYDQFADRLRTLAISHRPVAGDVPTARIGPVQNYNQFTRVKEMIADARDAGYAFISDPGDIAGPGYFIAPTIVDNPPDVSAIVREEPFGPVVPLLRFYDMDEVIVRANNSEYGLASSIWTKNDAAAKYIGERLEAGTVWRNSAQQLSPTIPFGGHKNSGIGVENSIEGLHEYTNIQVLVGC